MISIERRVQSKVNAYHKLQCYGVHKAAKCLNISVKELLTRYRGAKYYQAVAINLNRGE